MMIFSTCPYCGHENRWRADPQIDSQSFVIYCELEDGGCDQPYVVLLRIKAEVTVKAIEGYLTAKARTQITEFKDELLSPDNFDPFLDYDERDD